MAAFMKQFEREAYALLRIVAGLLFLWHGSQKLFGFPGGVHEGTPDFVTWIGGPIELVGGLLVMIGFHTRWAAFVCSGMMAVAYWLAHGTRALLPIQNGGELAALYCFVFLFLSARGSGDFAVDSLRGR